MSNNLLIREARLCVGWNWMLISSLHSNTDVFSHVASSWQRSPRDVSRNESALLNTSLQFSISWVSDFVEKRRSFMEFCGRICMTTTERLLLRQTGSTKKPSSFRRCLVQEAKNDCAADSTDTVSNLAKTSQKISVTEYGQKWWQGHHRRQFLGSQTKQRENIQGTAKKTYSKLVIIFCLTPKRKTITGGKLMAFSYAMNHSCTLGDCVQWALDYYKTLKYILLLFSKARKVAHRFLSSVLYFGN